MTKQRVAELQRQLHTLKGGARMAGISAMGDLSHELESLVIQIDGGAVTGDDRAHAVMQASLDELARMRDLVSTGELPGPAASLLAQIRGLSAAPARRAAPAALRRQRARASAPGAGGSDRPGCRHFSHGDSRAGAGSCGACARIPTLAACRTACRRGIGLSASAEDSIPSLEVSSAPVLPGRENLPAERVEMARVDADLLDTMLNNAGEVSIFRARLDQQVNSIDFNLAELAAHRYTAQGSAARSRNGDRSAGVESPSGRGPAPR